ncbi:glycoside hydrolase family 28 protein [Pelosinus propionicus]|uniref:Glycosyl hydrolases family 28 n=1 Tax=Pelosinus propionicus DSM 13327 TaxID=1123291 RepID=A0A1I4JWQ9_9FIRM|nr:glycosyl hydrolase family 28 protein [Pelosinus propionicus]SFL70627.1 Glycosyl hydrolases family 28 [Pelosinus propionicus DSM 13327]
MKKRVFIFLLSVSLLFLCKILIHVETTLPTWVSNIPPVPSTYISKDTPDNRNAIDPRNNGAKADGITDDGSAIQQAIDACAQMGGGIVILKNGTFLSSPLILKSDVYLKIEPSAVLKALPYANYPKGNTLQLEDTADYPQGDSPQPFITSEYARNFGIFGGGTIDGNGQDWWDAFEKTKGTAYPLSRTCLMYLFQSQNIIIKDVTLRNSPEWTVLPKNCENVIVSHVSIFNPPKAYNTDGINPSGSRNVYIDSCIIDTGDDNIAIKAHRAPTQNVYITNSTFYHGHGLSVGSETYKGVQNIYTFNCSFVNTDNAIRIKSARDRGSVIKNLHYANITMTDVGTGILLTMYYPKIPEAGVDLPQPIMEFTPFFEDISIDGLTGTAKYAGVIVGLPESPVKNLVLRNIKITAALNGLKVRNIEGIISNIDITAGFREGIIQEENSTLIQR